MGLVMYETKWRLDCLLKKFYNTQTYLKYQYDGEPFDSIHQKVLELNLETSKKKYDDLSKEDFKKYIDILPSICHSCDYWYRWNIDFCEGDRLQTLEYLDEAEEILKVLRPFIENKDFTNCPQPDWHWFMGMLWTSLAIEEYSRALLIAKSLEEFFMATKECKKVQWVPFTAMNYNMDIFPLNWSRHYLSLLIVIGKIYFFMEDKENAIKNYEKILDLGDGKFTKYGSEQVNYHLGLNRILESAVELYILKPTPENRKRIFKYFQSLNAFSVEPSHEAVMETILVNYFIYEEVFGETVR